MHVFPHRKCDHHPDLNATINDNALSTVDTVTYLYLHFILHLRETQSGPIMLSESLENVNAYPFLQRNFEGYQHLPSIFANLLRHVLYL